MMSGVATKSDERVRHIAFGWAFASALVYMWLLLPRGWVPHDEGTLGQSAGRVLLGELPHRDYEEIYTGGLAYLNALAFEIWGMRLIAMRYMAFVFYALWLPLLYYIASRWAKPNAAGLVTLAAVAWAFPNYPAPMPSWYVLFLATASVACLFRFLESQNRAWLAAAGVAAGVSCLFKIVGLYVIAAVLLFFVYHEQASAEPSSNPKTERPAARWYGLLASFGLVAFASTVFLLIRARLGLREFFQFVLPSWICVAALVANEWSRWRSDDGLRLRRLLGLLMPFGLGLVLVWLPVIVFYATQGGLEELLRGLFVTPFQRLSSAAVRPPSLLGLTGTALIAGPLVLAGLAQGRRATFVLLVFAPMLAALLLLGGKPGVGELVYVSLNQAVPVVVAMGAWLLWRKTPRGLRDHRMEMLALLVFLCATYTLVQYPFSTPTYFSYIAPFPLLAVAALSYGYTALPGAVLSLLFTFYTCFAILWFTPAQFRLHNSRGLLSKAEVPTLLPGLADLEVSVADWEEYTTLVPFVRAKAGGEYIFASPDCPEVYFLSGRRNPTRSLFDFFDPQEGRTAHILETIDRHGVRLAVINNRPLFSAPVEPELERGLRKRFPNDSVIGRFTVRWK